MAPPLNSPPTIRLTADTRQITPANIVNAIVAQLRRENHAMFSANGRARVRQRTGDFRDSIMSDFGTLDPTIDSERSAILQALNAEMYRRRQGLLEIGFDRANELQPLPPDWRLTSTDMMEYAAMEVRRRTTEMVERDVASGRLSVNAAGQIQLDSLVDWAVQRKISIEQDALPGCPPLVQASYQRLYQKMTELPATPVVAGARLKHKLRTTSLDVLIAKAARAAGSMEAGPVFVQLREMALNAEVPFTGHVEARALFYTTDDNKVDKLTKDSLGKRLSRARRAADQT